MNIEDLVRSFPLSATRPCTEVRCEVIGKHDVHKCRDKNGRITCWKAYTNSHGRFVRSGWFEDSEPELCDVVDPKYGHCTKVPNHMGRHMNSSNDQWGVLKLPTAAEHAAAKPVCAHGMSILDWCNECEL